MRIVFAAFLCITALTAYGQRDPDCVWSITGTVLDEHDNSPLDYATIFVKETDQGVVADSLGRFRIDRLCSGSYLLSVSHIGCESLEIMVQVRGNEEITIRLEHHAEVLETIELQAVRIRASATTTATELDRKTILRSSGRALGDALAGLPGVSALQTGPTIFKPVIQGLHSDRLLILNDGLRLESQQWGLDHAPEIDPSGAANISVVKGAAAVQYGTDAIGGVILVETGALPSTQSSRGDIHLTGIDNGRQIALSGKVARGFNSGFGASLHGTIRRAGDARAADYLLTNTGVSEISMASSVGYRNGIKTASITYSLFSTELAILRSAHIGNLSDLLEALERDRPFVIGDFSYRIQNPRQKVLHQTVQVKGQVYLNGLGLLAGQYAIQANGREEYDIRRGVLDDLPSLDLTLHTHTGLLSLAHEALGPLRGKLNLHWNYQQNKNMPGTGVRPLIPNFGSITPAVSLIEKFNVQPVEFELGARYEFERLVVKRIDSDGTLERPEFDFHNVATSAGLKWVPKDWITLLSHAGYIRRSPNVNELFSEGLHHGAAAIEEGDRSLVSEKAFKWIIGAEVRRPDIQVTANAFLQYINDFIYLRPTGEPRLTIRGAFPVFRYVQGDVRLYGGDLAATWQITERWSWKSEASVLRATERTRDEYLISMPADRMRHVLRWEQPASGTNAALSLLYVWKQKRVPEGVDYALPPDGYALVQAEFGTMLVRDKLDIHLTVRNLLNTAYREYLNRLRYYADDTGRSIEVRFHYTF